MLHRHWATLALLIVPQQATHVLLTRGASLRVMALLFLIELCLVNPLGVLTQAFRAGSAPFGALSGLWSMLVRHALVPVVVAMAVGVVLSRIAPKVLQTRKVTVSVATLAALALYVPHVWVTALAVALRPLGMVLEANVISALGWMACVPALWVMVHYAKHEQEESSPFGDAKSRTMWVTLLAMGTVLALAGATTAQYAYENRHAARPLLPGDTLAALTLRGLDGPTLDTQDLRGKVALLDVWATWCPPCVASMPGLQSLHTELASKNFALVSINVEPHALETVREFVKDRELTFPVYVDEGRAQYALRVASYPSLFLVDKHGVVRETYVGMVPEALLRRDIEALLNTD